MMQTRPSSLEETTIPFEINGGTSFGRYPKISSEQTFNMLESDGWMVDYAGYRKVLDIIPDGSARGIFVSSRFNHIVVVINDFVYAINSGLAITKIGNINSFSGDVYMAENFLGVIAISDGSQIYLYDYSIGSITLATSDGGPLNFTPGYIDFQNGKFVVAAESVTSDGAAQWRTSDPLISSDFPTRLTGTFQTEGDNIKATVRFPGRGNQLLVIGEIITEFWTDQGASPFPYIKSTSINIDYGTANPATIAEGENFLVWLGTNTKAGPVIFYTTGGDINQISNDGLNFKFANLTHPEVSTAFLLKQDGHLIYQICFYHPDDNQSYIYDFNTKKFFTVTDEHQNYHIAKKTVFFNNRYYFISLNDGNLYEINSEFTYYDYGNDKIWEIPRIIIPKTIRIPDGSGRIFESLSFPMEMGVLEDLPSIPVPNQPLYLATESDFFILAEDGFFLALEQTGESNVTFTPQVTLSISRDGGETFTGTYTRLVNPLGKRTNRIFFVSLGYGNEFTAQLRFHGFGRVVVGNGTLGARK